jgi:hypothetical protein
MSANLFQESRMTDLDNATKEYADAKQNYQRLVRLAVEEQDPAKRQDMLAAIRTENARLVHVVESLVAGWSEYNTNGENQGKIDDLETQLARFNKDLESVQEKQDTIYQLQSVLSTLMSEHDSKRNSYYGYIIAVLVLLIAVFIFFVYSYARSFFTETEDPSTQKSTLG